MRKSDGKWYIRFRVDGKQYNLPTGLEATERNKPKAVQMEEIARQRVLEGKAHHLRIDVVPFTEAADAFLAWAEGEYSSHSSYLRLKSSFSYAKHFFRSDIVAAIPEGRIDDFKSARRKLRVKEVSIRNDLHALSVFWQYCVRKHWARENIIRKVSVPSAKDAVRINVLSAEAERLYFDTCLWMHRAANFRASPDQSAYLDLHDFGRLMIQQGCRPEEVVKIAREDVDLANRWLYIRSGKSKAAKRRLKLTQESTAILARRLFAAKGAWLFPSAKTPQQHRGCTWQFSHGEVLKATAGRPHACEFVPYDLRHTYATRAVLDGMPLPVLAATLGHANLKSIEKYVHIKAENIDREVERIDELRRSRAVRSLGGEPAAI